MANAEGTTNSSVVRPVLRVGEVGRSIPPLSTFMEDDRKGCGGATVCYTLWCFHRWILCQTPFHAAQGGG